jgi:Flp pilus assembly protein TadG
MFSFLKKVWRDRRGNALVIAGAALPLVIGSAGLATDTIEWSLWKRQLQRAADSAALAGARAEVDGRTVDNCSTLGSATYAQPVAFDVQKNDHSGITTSCTASNPPASGTYSGDTNAVHVSLSGSRALSFSGMFMASAPTITTSATATLVDDGEFCLVTLSKTSTPGITMGGSSSAHLGCGAISNSTGDSSISTNGNAYNFQADPVASVGNMPDSVIGSTNLEPYHSPEPDPYANKYSTDVPSSALPCNKQVNGGNTNLTPGCFSSFSFGGNKSYTLAPGVYYLNNTNFDTSGTATITGTGVTIILTGTTPGGVTTNGNTTIKLSAQTSGTYQDMLFIQKAGSTVNNIINGNSGSFYDGAMYFPSTNVSFNGSSGAMTQCAMVVAYTATFTGNTNLQNSLTHPDGTPCRANTTVTAKRIALVE